MWRPVWFFWWILEESHCSIFSLSERKQGTTEILRACPHQIPSSVVHTPGGIESYLQCLTEPNFWTFGVYLSILIIWKLCTTIYIFPLFIKMFFRYPRSSHWKAIIFTIIWVKYALVRRWNLIWMHSQDLQYVFLALVKNILTAWICQACHHSRLVFECKQ